MMPLCMKKVTPIPAITSVVESIAVRNRVFSSLIIAPANSGIKDRMHRQLPMILFLA